MPAVHPGHYLPGALQKEEEEELASTGTFPFFLSTANYLISKESRIALNSRG
jgi:hypothetical protein